MKRTSVALALLIISVVCGIAGAQVTFKWGPYARLRYELWQNTMDMNSNAQDDKSFYRIKLSLWGQADFSKDASVFAKLTDESRAYIFNAGGDTQYNPNEGVFDNLYADWKNMFGKPLDLRFGRQDLLGMYGEGFLIADGTPVDGSRTYYFNAAKVAWKMGDGKSIDFLLIGDPKQDDLLPVINEQKSATGVKTQLNVADEAAFAAIYKGDPSKELHNEWYYIFKKEGGVGVVDNKLHTIGAYEKYMMNDWTFRGQLAYQTGDYGPENNTVKRTGLGGYAYADKSFPTAKCTPAASLGYIYLSGDDRSTTAVEGWDPLFSRYPWISELYVLSYTKETGVTGYWTNLSAIRLMVSANPCAKSKVSLWYTKLAANQALPVNAGIVGTGTDRGSLYQGRFDYTFTKNISSYVLYERLIPGDFYVASDPATFIRAEAQFKF